MSKERPIDLLALDSARLRIAELEAAIGAFRELADLERDKRLRAEAEVERLRDELGAALVRENNALALPASRRVKVEPKDPGARGWER